MTDILDSYTPSVEQIKQTELLLEIFEECEEKDIKISILGGVGLDILFGKLTRDHGDLDFGVIKENEASFVELIKKKGFKLYKTDEDGVNRYSDGITKLEYTTSDRKDKYPEISMKELFPKELKGGLLNKQLRTPTLQGHKWMIDIQNKKAKNKGWEAYSYLDHQKLLIKALEDRNKTI